MTGQSNRGSRSPIRVVALKAGDWSSGPLWIARTAPQRRRGVCPGIGPLGILLAARSIHGWGLTEPLRWVGLDRRGNVIAAGLLAPRRVTVAPRPVRWIAEIPVWLETPPIGERVRVVPILAGWPDD